MLGNINHRLTNIKNFMYNHNTIYEWLKEASPDSKFSEKEIEV